MKNSKFLSFLGTLSRKELLAFEQYLLIFHRKEKIALLVFSYLKPFYPKFDNPAIAFNFAYQEIFGAPLPADPKAEKKSSKKLLNALSDLFLFLKEFLIIQKVKKHPVEKELLWSRVLLERRKVRAFSTQYPELKKKLKASSPADVPGYLDKLAASYIPNYLILQDNSTRSIASLLTFIDDLDCFYASTRLKMACEIATQKNALALNLPMESAFQAVSLAGVLSPDLKKNNPLIVIYLELFQLIVNKQHESFEKAELLLREHTDSIEKQEQHMIVIHLLNYAAAQIRLGNPGGWSIVHRLNEYGIKKGLFIEGGLMLPVQFTNIINAACQTKSFKWAQNFVKDYAPYLGEGIRENNLALGQAQIAFEQGFYKKTISILKKNAGGDLFYELRVRSLILRSLCELRQENGEIQKYCFAFEQYIYRNKKRNTEAIASVLHFIKILKVLIFRKKDKAHLVNEIKTLKPIQFEDWLLRQVEVYYTAAPQSR
ncbi:MAG: hypothetical protein SH848_06465 [Saprospiraceae bacterium]|nr:hypothetical protein [Saprospiraceae bacterium]MDZ4703551.1 hypothetical protein [Saprospiraceae bacterium]